ncbi:NADH dehydrogenase [Fulvimarina manganoxydans]|uniref:NADH dehydrogenase n=1 Tax=Fulvimarina manganoxydans TaxID=937218 RepID=A0A1W2ES21_9HYPH|nr:FAD-dependent oxidoreductase [Fulvimarina manganoxydans]SMD12499.1 NADH dehydrogenase [Fulvimarina manganoxydans]
MAKGERIIAASSAPHIVVLGGGAGGLELACALAGDGRRVTLVDRVGSHLWKPRLHEFAAGTVDSTLSEMSFYTLASLRGFRFEQGEVEAVDRASKTVRLSPVRSPDDRIVGPGRSIPYDRLVVALGGVTPDFGTTGVAENAIRLDERSDADRFRELFVAAVLRARANGKPAKIAIIGSGATGTELAAHLRQAERAFLDQSEKERQTKLLTITLLEAAPEIMPGADGELRRSVSDRLDRLDITKHVDAKIAAVEIDGVRSADGESWPADITVWAAGLVGNPCLAQLADFEMDKKGRIVVDDRLRTSVDPAILAIGDAASFTPPGANAPLPPTAQCASQQAVYLANALPAMMTGKEPEPFVFQDRGRLLSLAQGGSVGSIGLFRSRDDILVEGQFALAAYHGLQRRHQWSVLGPLRGSVAILADMISPAKGPALKLHGG